MKRYSTHSTSTKVEPYYQMQFSVIFSTLFLVGVLSLRWGVQIISSKHCQQGDLAKLIITSIKCLSNHCSPGT